MTSETRLSVSLKECANNFLLTAPTSGALKVQSFVAQMIMRSVKYLGYCHEDRGQIWLLFPPLLQAKPHSTSLGYGA